MRGYDCWLTHELDFSNGRFLIPFLVHGMYILPTVLTVKTIFKDAALRKCAVETIGIVYVTEPS